MFNRLMEHGNEAKHIKVDMKTEYRQTRMAEADKQAKQS